MKLLLALCLLAAPAFATDTFLVENGQPRAEIVIAERPQRSVRLAAQELQDYMKKISGVHLPIVTQPSGRAVKVFVGRSTHTEALQVSAAGLQDGAFRMVSGADWLVLIGEDTEFTPIEPWGKHNTDLVNGRAQQEWRTLTQSLWGMPNLLIYKDRFTLPGDLGLPDAERTPEKRKPLELWQQDERGSFNAVCGFLMRLGVRWYLPGELQESYAVLDWEHLKIDHSVARLLVDPVVSATISFGFSDRLAPVLNRVAASHNRCWIHPPYRDLLNRLEALDHPRFRLRSVEIRERFSGALVAGELGYTMGSTYTSLTGFFCREDRKWNNYGKLQMVMLARALRDAGYAFWNLGHPYQDYKAALGARILPRHEFLNRWRVAIAEVPKPKSGSGLSMA